MWVWSRGYWASGVTDASFREGLLAALKKLDLPYEESRSVTRLPSLLPFRPRASSAYEKSRPVIRLPTIGADLHVTFWSEISSTIKVEPHKFARVLEEIVKEMNDYYRSSNVQTNKATGWYLLIFGAILTVLTGSHLFSQWGIFQRIP
jgi:hypothetical protein